MEDIRYAKSQYDLLIQINDEGAILRKGDENDMEQLWQLVRKGYVQNLVYMNGPYQWKFRLTEKGEKEIDL